MRTFVCIEICDKVRQNMSLLYGMLSEAGANVRWVDEENVHLTLLFLGEVNQRRIAEVCAAVGKIAAETKDFRFSVEGIGAFPEKGTPRVVWCGVKEHRGALEKLQSEIAEALRDYVQKHDRKKFVPHLTVGRVRGPKNADALLDIIHKNRGQRFGMQNAASIVVMMSDLAPGGPCYTPLGRWQLL